jgi:hypothetical protein
MSLRHVLRSVLIILLQLLTPCATCLRSCMPISSTLVSFSTVLAICLILFVSRTAFSEYTPSCSMYAGNLQTESRNYDSALSKFKRAKDDFESACSSYGYARNDEFACGEFGYTREEYRNTADKLKRAAHALESAMNSISAFCGIPIERAMENEKYIRALFKAVRENEDLKKRLKELENERDRYRELTTPTETK